MRYTFAIAGRYFFETAPDQPDQDAQVFLPFLDAASHAGVDLRDVMEAALAGMVNPDSSPEERAISGCMAEMCGFTMEQLA